MSKPITATQVEELANLISKELGEMFYTRINSNLRELTDRVENMLLRNLVIDLVTAIENGVEDQEIKYAEKVVNDNEELIKEIRK